MIWLDTLLQWFKTRTRQQNKIMQYTVKRRKIVWRRLMTSTAFWNFDLYSAGILVLVLSYLLVHCFSSSPFNVESLVQNWFKTIPPSLQYYVNIPSFLIRIFHRRYWIPKKPQEKSRKLKKMSWNELMKLFFSTLTVFPSRGPCGLRSHLAGK